MEEMIARGMIRKSELGKDMIFLYTTRKNTWDRYTKVGPVKPSTLYITSPILDCGT